MKLSLRFNIQQSQMPVAPRGQRWRGMSKQKRDLQSRKVEPCNSKPAIHLRVSFRKDHYFSRDLLHQHFQGTYFNGLWPAGIIVVQRYVGRYVMVSSISCFCFDFRYFMNVYMTSGGTELNHCMAVNSSKIWVADLGTTGWVLPKPWFTVGTWRSKQMA